MSNRKPLVRCCEDGNLEIDNNGAECSLRGAAIGPINRTSLGSDSGGRTAAVLTRLIATSKRPGVDTSACPRDLFERISSHPQAGLAEFLPDQ